MLYSVSLTPDASQFSVPQLGYLGYQRVRHLRFHAVATSHIRLLILGFNSISPPASVICPGSPAAASIMNHASVLAGGAATAQLLAPIQDDIDLRGLSSCAALLVDEEA